MTYYFTFFKAWSSTLLGVLLFSSFVFDYCDNFFRWTELIYAKLDLGDVLILCNTNFVDLTPVLLADEDFELELLVEWTRGVLNYVLLIGGTLSYFLALSGFFGYDFFTNVAVELALTNVTFYFFFDSGFSILFI